MILTKNKLKRIISESIGRIINETNFNGKYDNYFDESNGNSDDEILDIVNGTVRHFTGMDIIDYYAEMNVYVFCWKDMRSHYDKDGVKDSIEIGKNVVENLNYYGYKCRLNKGHCDSNCFAIEFAMSDKMRNNYKY